MKWNKLKLILGFILLPIMIIVYCLDRYICVPLFWLHNYTLVKWLNNNAEMVSSIIRVLLAALLYVLYLLIF